MKSPTELSKFLRVFLPTFAYQANRPYTEEINHIYKG